MRMERVLVIGCPGSGKSTFARALAERTGLPLYYLDMLFHRPDRTTVSHGDFDAALGRLLAEDRWILDGNYARTLPVRLARCDRVFWLDYPTELCLESVRGRRGQVRPDMPWVETEEDPEFMAYIAQFRQDRRPEMEAILERSGREVTVFRTREEAAAFLSSLER